jgi:glutathione synthase/RimK-type ligase-like ATP-grasp enzyme
VYVLHENDDWLGPFAAAFDEAGVPWEPWFLDGGAVDLSMAPPDGVFWSRMSASSHTRGHVRAKPHTRSLLSWLEAFGRRVVNGRSVLELEMSKVDQYTALSALGVDVPRTVAVIGDDRAFARRQARALPAPFITKDNQGGKGLGVRRFDRHEAFDRYLDSVEFEPPVDDTLLLQEYVTPAEPFITRAEIVGGEFLYALTADTSQGFELCPADACRIDDLACPADDTPASLFSWREGFTASDAAPWVEVARRLGIEIAGFEFIETSDGRRVTYDINTNTNYNPDVEKAAPRSGPASIAAYLGRLLAAEQDAAA